MKTINFQSSQHTFTNFLDKLTLLFLEENSVFYIPNLNQSLNDWMQNEQYAFFESVKNMGGESIIIRDFLIELFESLGIIIAFSGKNDAEKGVVLDTEFDKMLALGLQFDHFKMGQTIIRSVGEENLNIFVENRHDISECVILAAQYLRENIAISNTKYFI